MTGIRNLILYIVNLGLAVSTFFLGFRILLELFGANPAAPFATWIYNVSHILINPFASMFPNLVVSGTRSVFDVVALIALVAYGIAAQLVIALVEAVFVPTTTTYTKQVI